MLSNLIKKENSFSTKTSALESEDERLANAAIELKLRYWNSGNNHKTFTKLRARTEDKKINLKKLCKLVEQTNTRKKKEKCRMWCNNKIS